MLCRARTKTNILRQVTITCVLFVFIRFVRKYIDWDGTQHSYNDVIVGCNRTLVFF